MKPPAQVEFGGDPDPGDEPQTHARDCVSRSRSMGWLTDSGQFVGARCGASNRCPWCGFLYAIETAQAVYLDAERGGYPRVVMTLTTRAPATTPEELRRGVEHVIRAIRRRAPGAEYLMFVEWTTGKGRRSGGHRRVHAHLLLKHVYEHHLEALPSGRWGTPQTLEEVVREVWSDRTGAHVVEVERIRSAWGAAKYLTHHHNKPSQAPPAGLQKGFKRLRPSKGYFGGRLTELREEVRGLERDRRVRAAARRMLDEAWDPDALDVLPDEVWEQEWREALDDAKRRRHESRPQLVKRVKVGDRWVVVSEFGEGEQVGVEPDGRPKYVGRGWSSVGAAVSRYRDLLEAVEAEGYDREQAARKLGLSPDETDEAFSVAAEQRLTSQGEDWRQPDGPPRHAAPGRALPWEGDVDVAARLDRWAVMQETAPLRARPAPPTLQQEWTGAIKRARRVEAPRRPLQLAIRLVYIVRRPSVAVVDSARDVLV